MQKETNCEPYSFDKWEDTEKERFNNLPSSVKAQTFEYYTFIKSMEKGYKPTKEESTRIFELLEINLKHDISASCFDNNFLEY